MLMTLPVSVTCDISVIIVSYNTRDMTLACVESVYRHGGRLKTEVIIVDNCSSDGSAEALRARFPQAKVIDSPHNGGFAYGNAIGFSRSQGKYLLLLNPDTQIYESTLEAAFDHMEAQGNIGVLGPRVWLDNGEQQSSIIRYLDLTLLFFIIFVPGPWMRRTSLFGDLRYATLSRDETHDVDAVAGCFMLVRRDMVRQTGGLDIRFFMYGEEVEWCWRITRAGWRIVYYPEAEILHHGGASTAHMPEWKAVEMARGQILFLRFTRGRVIAWIGTLLMLLRDLLRMPFYVLQTVPGGFRPSPDFNPRWARLTFLICALVRQPAGQNIELPVPVDMAGRNP
ncbi:MAG: glycosyltransferase family 2 protein [Sphingomonadaceae bacterium]